MQPRRSTRVFHRLDLALWNLPVRLRKALVTPLAIVLAAQDFFAEGSQEFRRTWHWAMQQVEER